MVRHDPGRRIDGERVDFLRRVVRHVLDVHAALGREHEGDAARLPIDQRGEVELLVDIGAVLDVEAVDLLAGRPGLHGDQRRAEHLFANCFTSSIERASRTPPLSPAEASLNLPLPRPPAWIWLFTTQSGPPSFCAASTASSGVNAGTPLATGAAKARSTLWPDIHGCSSEGEPQKEPAGYLAAPLAASARIDRLAGVDQARSPRRPTCRTSPSRPRRM